MKCSSNFEIVDQNFVKSNVLRYVLNQSEVQIFSGKMNRMRKILEQLWDRVYYNWADLVIFVPLQKVIFQEASEEMYLFMLVSISSFAKNSSSKNS